MTPECQDPVHVRGDLEGDSDEVCRPFRQIPRPKFFPTQGEFFGAVTFRPLGVSSTEKKLIALKGREISCAKGVRTEMKNKAILGSLPGANIIKLFCP